MVRTARLVFMQSMGGEWAELSKFILNWENGTRVACNNCANRIELEICISYISVTDKVDINETNTSIATGLLYV